MASLSLPWFIRSTKQQFGSSLNLVYAMAPPYAASASPNGPTSPLKLKNWMALYDSSYSIPNTSLISEILLNNRSGSSIDEMEQWKDLLEDNQEQNSAASTGSGRPKKVDIDKMHTYQDAIQDQLHNQVVQYAAILYPSSDIACTKGLEALRAYPGQEKKIYTKTLGECSAAF